MASPMWTAGAIAGEHPADVCDRSGRLLPERATYVRRAGGVVLGLDHYCGWLGTPVGLYNRKLFVLFVLYSFVFTAVGAAHSLYALLCALPDDLLPSPAASSAGQQCMHLGVSEALRAAIGTRRVGACAFALLQTCHETFAKYLHLLGAAYARGQLAYALLLAISVPANVIVGVMLGHLALYQLMNALRNRTTLEPNGRKYDVGAWRNWRQVFGDNPLTWLLPTTPRISASDGYSWPLNPNHRIGGSGRRGGAPGRARVGESEREGAGGEIGTAYARRRPHVAL